MMISTKGRYALRVMTDLAMNGENGFVSLTDISERQDVSLKYLETIVASLTKEGFLLSHRGKNGGYRLARQASEYTVRDILRTMEGTLAPVGCLDECGSDNCRHAAKCLTQPLWKQLDDVIDGYLESVTLADVLTGNVFRPELMNALQK